MDDGPLEKPSLFVGGRLMEELTPREAPDRRLGRGQEPVDHSTIVVRRHAPFITGFANQLQLGNREAPTPTYAPHDRLHAVDVTGFRTFRQVAFLGTFEGQTEIVLGVRARLPFRVFFLSGPGAGSRVVIDVAHRW